MSVAALGTLLGAGPGCAGLGRDLARDGVVRLEIAPSEKAVFSRVRVYEDDGDLVVYGKVGRQAGVKGRVDAKIRVVAHFPDGRTLERTTRAFPPHLPIRRSRKSNFTVRFEGQPPSGTVVRIEFPPQPYGPSKTSMQLQPFQATETRL